MKTCWCGKPSTVYVQWPQSERLATVARCLADAKKLVRTSVKGTRIVNASHSR